MLMIAAATPVAPRDLRMPAQRLVFLHPSEASFPRLAVALRYLSDVGREIYDSSIDYWLRAECT
jgi:hypothetical protein